MIIISLRKFKTYKYDAAPFFFFIDIFPPDTSTIKYPHLKELISSIKSNPIMPLPMRIDRVFNGESSILIHPREPISFKIGKDLIAIINPTPFIHFGIEKLLYFTELRAHEKLHLSLLIERANKWWNSTRFLHGNLYRLEEDFSDFLRTYLHTVVKAKINETDPIKAATEYCQKIADICNKRIEENSIIVELRGEQRNVKLYRVKEVIYRRKKKRVKETQYHPELAEIEVFNFSKSEFFPKKDERNGLKNLLRSKEMKYIPILFYDDLLECMLQDLKILKDTPDILLDPSFLLEKNVIVLKESMELEKIDTEKFSWWNTFDDIDLELILASIKTTLKEYFLIKYKDFNFKVDRLKRNPNSE
ncbi:MAG: hypothetical protein ACFE9T_06390 [Promethearchaeota archaeon]